MTCKCGKTLDKIPAWMEGTKVEFVCNACPNRQTKNIAFMSLEPGGGAPKAKFDEEEVEGEVEEEVPDDL